MGMGASMPVPFSKAWDLSTGSSDGYQGAIECSWAGHKNVRSEWWVAGGRSWVLRLSSLREGFRVGFLYSSAIDIWVQFIL